MLNLERRKTVILGRLIEKDYGRKPVLVSNKAVPWRRFDFFYPEMDFFFAKNTCKIVKYAVYGKSIHRIIYFVDVLGSFKFEEMIEW